MTRARQLYGVMAEFERPEELRDGARQARERGYRKMDAYTPYPIEGLAEDMGLHNTAVPAIVLTGGIIGCIGGFYMQYYAAAISYPVNIGGRPLNSWPSFIPITFELTILTAALFALLGMLALNGLPMPHHPVFNEPRFAMATRNRFFLCIEATDPIFDSTTTRRFLEGLSPKGVYDIDDH